MYRSVVATREREHDGTCKQLFDDSTATNTGTTTAATSIAAGDRDREEKRIASTPQGLKLYHDELLIFSCLFSFLNNDKLHKYKLHYMYHNCLSLHLLICVLMILIVVSLPLFVFLFLCLSLSLSIGLAEEISFNISSMIAPSPIPRNTTLRSYMRSRNQHDKSANDHPQSADIIIRLPEIGSV